MIMTAKNTKNARPSSAPRKATASRREFVAGAVTMAAAAGAATSAEAQTPTNLRFFNPPGMSNPPGYSHVVEVTGPHRTVYFAGQTGADANGKVSKDFREQAIQVFENIKIALASVGAGFEHVVKVTAITPISRPMPRSIARCARCISRTRRRCRTTPCCRSRGSPIRPAYQIELEFIAILPPKG
jgi:enamine deaminase RidA (YjgF/YER057c/UK114 family)